MSPPAKTMKLENKIYKREAIQNKEAESDKGNER
jgi:hypothetical protein